MNDLRFAGRYQCLPIGCFGRLISVQNEHSVLVYGQKEKSGTYTRRCNVSLSAFSKEKSKRCLVDASFFTLLGTDSELPEFKMPL
jgi:hypothetical protein